MSHPSVEPAFWHDEALPFIEARAIEDGSKVCYARHSHDTFSVGVVTSGQSTYLNGKCQQRIGAGSVVVMNPGDMHACNPIGDAPWGYRMLYLDAAWLAGIQADAGELQGKDFQPFATTWTLQPALYATVNETYEVLTDSTMSHIEKLSAVLTFALTLQQALDPARATRPTGRRNVARAAEFIRDNCTRALRLEEICAASGLSASYLIRAFKEEYGMTPHAYLINRRIEFCRSQLRRGQSIAEVALAAGFSDQAHLQRSFKKYVAATPGQYRSVSRLA